MENYIECKPVMLPTDKYHGLYTMEGQIGYTPPGTFGECGDIYQALYLVSDREIKEGDWVWDGRLDPQPPDWPIYRVEESDDIPDKGTPDRKIEATTNPFLGLPLIPQSFIEEYASEQGKIDEVKIEIYSKELAERLGYDYRKPRGVCGNNPSHPEGEVIILPIKDSWNRDELKKALERGAIQFGGSNIQDQFIQSEFDEWFDKNY